MKPTYIGVAVACLYIAFKMILFFAGIQNDILAGKVWLVLIGLVLMGIFFAIISYTRTSDTYDWMIAFKRALTVSLTASVLAGIFVFVYYKFIDTGYLENLAINEYNQLKTQIPADKLEEYNKSLKSRYRANTFAIMTVSIVNIAGLIGSLIVGMMGRLMLKRI